MPEARDAERRTGVETAPERVLVRLPNWLGDVLLARSLLHGLRAARPAASITIVAPAPLLELLADDGVADLLEPWPAPGPTRAALIGRLRARALDVALVLPPSFSSAWFSWRAGARVRIGYRSEFRDALLTDALVRPARGDTHLSNEYVALGRRLGVEPCAPRPLPVPPAARERAAELLDRLRLGAARLAVLGPGARYGPAKRWPEERFAEVGTELARSGHDVLVCGARDERDVCERVARAIGTRAHVLAGDTDLLGQAGLLARSAIAVCNDSGLAHLAAAVGAPTVAVFGSTSSAWTAPLGGRVSIVQRAPVCSPCFQRTCRIGYRCLTAVTGDAVLQAAARVQIA